MRVFARKGELVKGGLALAASILGRPETPAGQGGASEIQGVEPSVCPAPPPARVGGATKVRIAGAFVDSHPFSK